MLVFFSFTYSLARSSSIHPSIALLPSLAASSSSNRLIRSAHYRIPPSSSSSSFAKESDNPSLLCPSLDYICLLSPLVDPLILPMRRFFTYRSCRVDFQPAFFRHVFDLILESIDSSMPRLRNFLDCLFPKANPVTMVLWRHFGNRFLSFYVLLRF